MRKKNAEPEMGYCQFEHWLGRTRRLGAHSTREQGWALGAGLWVQAGVRGARARQKGGVLGRQAGCRRACGACGRQARGAAGARGAWPVRAGWAKLVHCAPGSVLTRFFTQF